MAKIDPSERLDHIRRIGYFKALERFLTEDLDEGYTALLSILFNEKYVWRLPMDENREVWGRLIREEYLDHLSLEDREGWEKSLDGECSVLEMLIALAWSMEKTFGLQNEKSTPKWFWMMLSNLDIAKYTDSITGTKESETIQSILRTWMDGKYDNHTGVGSPFPLKTPMFVTADDFGLQNVDAWRMAQLYMTQHTELMPEVTRDAE